MFNMMKSKISYLKQNKYNVESRLDSELKPMTQEQMQEYTTNFT